MKYQRKRHENTRIVAAVAAILVVFAGVFAVIYFAGNGMMPDTSTLREIEHEGERYAPNDAIVTYLLIGVDSDAATPSSSEQRNHGLASFIALFAFDIRQKSCTVVHINQDTVAQIRVLDANGKVIDNRTAQIALSHSYGSRAEDSALNTVAAVSELLHSVPITYYISLTMDGLAAMNDAVGGVSILVEDDFSSVDVSLRQGERIMLSGEQAVTFLRSHAEMKDDSLSQMARQQQYMKALYAALSGGIKKNPSLIRDIYEGLVSNMTTNCSIYSLLTFGDRVRDYSLVDVISLTGETAVQDGNVAYCLDETALMKTVLDIFYKKK